MEFQLPPPSRKDTMNPFYIITPFRIVSTFLKEDEIRMVRYLLSNTTLQIKIKGVESKPFKSNIGSSQGDGLSGKLYTIYFEASLRELRPILDQAQVIPPTLPEEVLHIKQKIIFMRTGMYFSFRMDHI